MAESTRRLSSLLEATNEDLSSSFNDTRQEIQHRHHRIISFDPSSVTNLSTREIQEHNEVQMSLVSSLTTAPMSQTTTQRRPLAMGVKKNVATPEDVESKKTATAVRAHHIVRIFTPGENEVTELTPEQVKRIKKMHERIESAVNFSFNYNVLLLVASVIAGLGLVSNGSATIIASMLVSPIMGPVIGLAYGTTIWDWKLLKKSLRNETISLAFCILMGMVIAACTGWTKLSEEWPTDEMISRGNLQNLYVSLPVAFFSGLGVAVSILDDQTSSLVGVAISASLLPPAVDAGILWIAYAFTKHGVLPPITLPAQPDDPTQDEVVEGDEEYSRVDYRHMGAVALGVTLANIVLIWVSSMLMFRIKEVLPIEKKVFWDDLKMTRRIYQRRALLQVVEVTPHDEDPEPIETMQETNEETNDDNDY